MMFEFVLLQYQADLPKSEITAINMESKGELVQVQIVHPILQVLLQELESLLTFFPGTY